MPADSMTRLYFAVSRARKVVNCSGVLATTVMPSLYIFCLISGCVSTLESAPCRTCTVSLGVAAGTSMPYQLVMSNPGTVAAIGGMSGAIGEGCGLVTPSPRNLPSLISGRHWRMFMKYTCTRPPSTSTNAGPAPLYGTDTSFTPAETLKSSADKCGNEPIPALPTFNCPGCDLASAINSFTDFTGSDGCTTSTSGPDARRVTGARSFAWSYGSDW